MKKAFLFIACFAFVIMLFSGFASESTAPSIGYVAPEFKLTDNNKTLSLHNLKGENVLVTFWSSTNADSRIRCNQYDAFSAYDNSVRHLAINLDQDKDLFEQIVILDNMTASMQYHIEGGIADEIMSDYHLDRGLHSFLINNTGKIVAIDPDADTMKSLL